MWFSKLVICIKVNLHVKSLFFADHIFLDSLKTIRCVMSLEENIFFRMPRDIFLFWSKYIAVSSESGLNEKIWKMKLVIRNHTLGQVF